MRYEGYKQGRQKSKGGLIRAFVKLKGNRIEDSAFSGDFFLFPETAIEQIAQSIKGANATLDTILSAVQSVYESEGVIAPGIASENFMTSIMQAVES